MTENQNRIETATDKTAVLIVNTGSPAAPTKEAVAQYLLEFLGDRRVVEMHPLLWQPILRGIIIPRRAQASADRYKTVWTEEGSPLMAITNKTARVLQEALGDDFTVDWAMCYGTHRIGEVLEKIAATKPARIVVLPLYAQYATQTTAAVYDAVDAAVKKLSLTVPVVRINDYFDHAAYIEALAQRVQTHWREKGALGEGGKLLMSFHGIPQASSDRGDPYEKQCRQTAKLLQTALGLRDDQVELAFQSKFGKAKWLEPSAIATAERLGHEQLSRLDVICPGFAADCLETLEEIATELKGIFQSAGGGHFHYIECMNAEPAAGKLYAELVRYAVHNQA
ncbi:MAG: ferrochelatase [Sutterellaceae bacterium]|nr:ferrochelatase [Sutterellaceae bacterium]